MPLDTHNTPLLRTHRRTRQGQTAVVALLVLLLLAFVGALFITIIARNLKSQGRSHRTLNADYYAEAGLRFADDQLTNSLDGADWRPPLQDQLVNGSLPQDTRALARYNATKPTLNDPTQQPFINDPDVTYLEQGFSRYNTESGRFLLRVTYDPIHQSTTDNPNARYLKIESIGREGVVIPNDPTTFTNQPPSKLAATLVAYKPIGITDYARFETNIDNRNDTANLGVPSIANGNSGIVTAGVFDFNLSGTNSALKQYPLVTVYGAPDAYMKDSKGRIYPNPNVGQGTRSGNGTYTPSVPTGYTAVPGGGPVRANMPLRFYGENVAYLNRDNTTTVQDGIEVAGNLLLNDYLPSANTTNLQNQSSALILNAPANPTAAPSVYVAPSNGSGSINGNAPVGTPFDTFGGTVRDGGTGSNASDAEGSPRSIARLDPPAIDTVSRATQLSRYQDITENSPPRFSPGTTTPFRATYNDGTTTSADGFGQSIYVNNTSDVQRDSSSLVGGHTLVDEWLNRNSGGQSSVTAKSGWQGPFYNPPGVDITFGIQRADIGTANSPNVQSFYGVRLTRSDVDASGKPALWKDPTDTNHVKTIGPTLIVSYNDLNASNIQDPAATGYKANAVNPNNDVVIYAEGNIRVRPSLISQDPNVVTKPTVASDVYPRHITLITNGTAYIEGSILKGNPDSSVTILARDYVCLNTTQFYSGAITDENGQSAQPPRASGADSTLLDFAADSDVLVQDFNFNPPQVPTTVALYVSGGPSAAGATAAQYDFINPSANSATAVSLSGSQPFVTPFQTATFDTATGVNGGGSSNGPTGLTHITFDLKNAAIPNGPLQLWTRRGPGVDQVNNTTAAATATQDYVQERSAILPADIKIQAVLYAQNKSFFVIPGPWFNSDTGDNLTAFAAPANRPLVRPGINVNDTSNSNDHGDQGRFPFYGQPVDLKITVDGAVSEARPADISAQAAWMQKWGWIPQYHGSNLGLSGTTGTTAAQEPAGHPGFDPLTGNPAPATGLTLIYDPEAGYPFNAAGGNYYLRSDAFGRPLPFTPKLPVSTGLLYAGQGDPQATLQ